MYIKNYYKTVYQNYRESIIIARDYIDAFLLKGIFFLFLIKDVTQLFERSQRILNRTKNSKQIGEEAFLNAKHTLNLLLNFNTSLKTEKERTIKAKNLEVAIQNNIDEVESMFSVLAFIYDDARKNITHEINIPGINQKINNAKIVRLYKICAFQLILI